MRPHLPVVQITAFVTGLLLLLSLAAQFSTALVAHLQSYWAHGGSSSSLSWIALLASFLGAFGAFGGFTLGGAIRGRPTPGLSCLAGCLCAGVTIIAAVVVEIAGFLPNPIVLFVWVFGLPFAASFILSKVSQHGQRTHG